MQEWMDRWGLTAFLACSSYIKKPKAKTPPKNSSK